MSLLWYVSRTAGEHDRRWVALLREMGHEVCALSAATPAAELRRLAAQAPPAGVVAGPLTDALPRVVDAGLGPVMGISWAFDVLLECQDGPTRSRVQRALRDTALVHVDSADLRQRVVAMGFDADRIVVSAWGVDLDTFSVGPPSIDVRAEAGFTQDDLVVLTARAWERIYAVDVVLNGFALALRDEPRLRLAWAGTGSLHDELEGLARRLGIDDRVAILGRLEQDRLRDWMRAAEVYVSAASSDGSSLTMLQAMGCGLQVVVTDLPSNREWVTDDRIGRLFPEGDPVELGAQLTAAVRRPVDRQRIREAVLERGDWTRNRVVFADAVTRLLGLDS